MERPSEGSESGSERPREGTPGSFELVMEDDLIPETRGQMRAAPARRPGTLDQLLHTSS